ncbi:siderophore ABC transporter substrate-binding protein [Saxibacter everestensis]|uniref:Siderophore ABC transporter substrate-binding protein n=1 Tax=Saxibacter everestensis TaxID=2909229 RepID=A0ABY8QQA3_9MICO|nr:siderophore ABC transporter substrate-binding protein [Brevibacteriaceae bacterium ZFBP1038]
MRPISSRILLAGVAAVAATSLAACGGQASADAAAGTETVSITHAQGTTEVPVDPEKVVTFDIAALDTIDTLGVDEKSIAGAPKKGLPEFLSGYAGDDYANVGSVKEPDLEAVNAADPDLIIISGRTAGSYDDLSDIAPTIDLSVDSKNYVESFSNVTESIGKIFDREDGAKSAIAELNSRIDETRTAGEKAGTGLIVMTSGGEVTAYGAGSRFGFIHDVLGVKTATDVKQDGKHGESISFEYIAEANPDHLFVIDRDAAIGQSGEAASQVLDNDLVNGTSAAKNGKTVYLDSTSWYILGSGLTTVNSMVDEVAKGLG